ncbi:hypothetical protein [Sphingomonas quercus]|uniref:PsiF repeat-containing protein n=1 Tax=Sphingomonas quercus TaxID=2842451 RepID=A0ABS6BPK1_9SPHN|nr:hypothetical protein [Sphingomonas quercus]MBU3079135.1 hypothetical protein [Sphingomonas quercus]
MRRLIALPLMLAVAGLSVPATAAAPCKDAKGRFTKCPDKKPATTRCKDAKGKFAKCGTPGAKPV